MPQGSRFEYLTYIEGNPGGMRDVLQASTALARPSVAELSDAYTSVFFFSDDLAAYVAGNGGKVRGFKGAHLARGVHWDIDCGDNLEAAQESTTILVNRLIKWGAEPDLPAIFFSGSKGFHVLLWDAFELPPSQRVHDIIRKMALELAEGIPHVDPKVYAINQLWRLPNTVNSKTGLYKVRLSLDELEGLTMDAIKDLATMPREPMGMKRARIPSFQKMCDRMSEQAKNPPAPAKPKIGQRKFRRDRKMCIQRIMEGVREGGRNDACMR
jgi:hypothetical protein